MIHESKVLPSFSVQSVNFPQGKVTSYKKIGKRPDTFER